MIVDYKKKQSTFRETVELNTEGNNVFLSYVPWKKHALTKRSSRLAWANLNLLYKDWQPDSLTAIIS